MSEESTEDCLFFKLFKMMFEANPCNEQVLVQLLHLVIVRLTKESWGGNSQDEKIMSFDILNETPKSKKLFEIYTTQAG
jgi:hypothetical protein